MGKLGKAKIPLGTAAGEVKNMSLAVGDINKSGNNEKKHCGREE
ncbi:MAG TPA: hypothetical protein PLS32_01780 [Bacillota bacterium]|nr:hypothetical protein [Bacillota bacterium]HPZ65029.1 hypothetical protein [Bacillota bacterium]HQD05302.1 hypothetical protein [Bacillota bacterium]